MGSSKEIDEFLEFFQEIGVTEVSAPKIKARLEFLDRQAPPPTEQAPQPGAPFSIPKAEAPKTTRMSLPPRMGSLFEPSPAGGKQETLAEVRDDLGDCQRCKLSPLRKNIVFGSGNPRAELMFIGEAPGADEDAQGLPFVGRAGQLLTRIIEAMGMKREDVYICNVLKCRPPENRAPERDEIESCEPFLLRQIEAVKPKVIVCLGSPAMQTLLKMKVGITNIRGQWMDYNGIKLMATFHPAYCLRWPDKKREVWEDMKKVRDYLRFADSR